eukprot:TRINITY_DN3717_c0_g1_i2.p1 TRINITY_DN3717_c0_g1~~TRINITY_DN3717_c0_g1_i2.p1  ORF type:complete len:415 (+),score=148.58 TRINITY_DN3717_c0_g1_i2:82-1245(+)
MDRLRHGSKDEVHNFLCVTGMMLVGAVASLAWGCYEFGNSEQDVVRAQHVAVYNKDVLHWEEDVLPALRQIPNITVSGWGGGSVVLRPVVGGASGVLDHGDDLEMFTPFRFEYSGEIPLPETSGWQQLSANLSVEIPGQLPQPLRSQPVVLTRSEEIRTGNWKQCQYHHRGSLDTHTHTCTTYRVLSHLCVTLARAGQGQWVSTGKGCKLPLDAAAEPVFSIVPSPRYQTTPPGPRQTRIPHAMISIRSAVDPFLVALNETSGTREFGVTEQQRVAMGVVGLTLAATLGLGAAAMIFCFAKGIACYESMDSLAHRREKHRVSFSGIAEVPDLYAGNDGPAAVRKQRKSRDKHVMISEVDPDDIGLGIPAPAHLAPPSDEIEMGQVCR